MKKSLDRLERTIEAIMILLVALFTILVGVQVVSRYVFNNSITWSEQAARYMFVWLVMLGLPILYRHGEHVGFTMLTEALPRKGQLILEVITHILVMVFAALWAKLAIEYCAQLGDKKMVGLGIRQVYVYSSQIASAVLLGIFTLERLVVDVILLVKKNKEG